MSTNEFIAEDEPGTVTIAPPTPGNVMSHHLEDETLYSIDGVFIAGTDGIDIDSEVGGLKSVLGAASSIPLALRGTGAVFIGAYVGIEKLELAAGESYVLDNQHLIAWDDEIEYSTRRVGGLKSTLLSGEGLVFEFTRPGTAWSQTRNMDSPVEILASRMPSQGSIERE